jgi:rSAM/selenodomain-associated transferase 1
MKAAVVVMSRIPNPGCTKTRLMTKLSGEDCAAFHRACLCDIGKVIKDSGLPGYIYYTGDYTSNDYSLLPEDYGKCLKTCSQTGNDLGERLYNAGLDIIAEFDAVIFLGSDLPDLNPDLLKSAVEKLEKYDIVIGPASDGGYYLLGIKQIIRDVFEDIPWGTSKVLKSTIEKLRNNELSYALLEIKSDIDTWADLVGFYLRGKGIGNDIYKQMAAYNFAEKLVNKYIAGGKEDYNEKQIMA